MTAPREAGFWRRVDQSNGRDACWPWMGFCQTQGYGQVRWGGRILRAHRVAWMLARGPIPDGLFVCHACDNRPCCNPAHLWLGTNQDNMRDAFAKGRISRAAEANGQAKLTLAVVVALKERRAAGERVVALAREYGVNKETIRRACTGKTWAA